MKQKRVAQNKAAKPIKQKQSRRREIARLPRCLVITLSIILLAAALLATYARFRPVVLTLPTQVYRYSRSADINYQVQNKTTDSFGQSVQGMDSIYLRSNAMKILPVIRYEISGNRVVSISGSYQMVGIIRLRDKTNPNSIIHEKTISLSERTDINTVASGLNLEVSAQADLTSIYEMIDALELETDQEVSYELEAGLQTDFDLSSSGQEILKMQERPGMIIPLGNDTFTISLLKLDDKGDSIWRLQNWQLELTPMPTWLYPVAILLSLLLLVYFLATTRGRKHPRFNRQIRKMMRMARGRLMLIGDKAWEPEWCITASNYKTMVKTARKLKHPIFCYIDHDSKVPSAFFYVYYGENNYCYTYTGKSDRKWDKQVKDDRQTLGKLSVESTEPLINLPAPGVKKTMADVALPVDELPANKSRENK